jgi:hypothetical protein
MCDALSFVGFTWNSGLNHLGDFFAVIDEYVVMVAGAREDLEPSVGEAGPSKALLGLLLTPGSNQRNVS